MKAKIMLQFAGLLAILLLVLVTAGYYLNHPEKRGQDVQRFEHQR